MRKRTFLRHTILAFAILMFALVLTTCNNGDSNTESGYESPSGPEWHIMVVDSTGDVGLDTSLAVVNGNPAISYYDSVNSDLKYVRASDASGGSWGAPVTVDSTGDVGWHTSLAVVNGNPAISYHDVGNDYLKYVRATDASGADWSSPVTVDGGCQQCGAGSVRSYTSLLVVNGNPAISYFDGTYYNYDLKYVRASDASGSAWGTPVTVDRANALGSFASLVVVNGNPAISHVSCYDLKYVRAFNASGSAWGDPVTVDSDGHAGEYSSLAVVNGRPAISYFDEANRDLKYVRATDASGAAWSSPVTIDSAGSVGFNSSLVVVNGNPAISYFKAGGDLKYVRASDAGGSAWEIPVTLDTSVGIIGLYAHSLAVVNGRPAISYCDVTNFDLKYAIYY